MPGESYTSARCNLYLRDQLAATDRWGLQRQRFYAALLTWSVTSDRARRCVVARMVEVATTVAREDPQTLGVVMLDFCGNRQRQMVLGTVRAIAARYSVLVPRPRRFCSYHVINIVFALYLSRGLGSSPAASFLEDWIHE